MKTKSQHPIDGAIDQVVTTGNIPGDIMNLAKYLKEGEADLFCT